MPYSAFDPALAAAAPVTTIGEPQTGAANMTFQEFQDDLQQELLGRDEASVVGRLGQWVNRGYIDLLTSIELDILNGSMAFPLVSGQALYLLPKVVYALTKFSVVDSTTYLDGGRPLQKIDRDQYRRLPDCLDEPVAYFRFNNGGADMLVVYPTPIISRTSALEFVIRPSYMTDPTDQPITGVEWDEGISLAARWKALLSLKDFESAPMAEKAYLDFVRRKNDPKQAEDADRIVLSSRPRSRRELFRDRTYLRDQDGLY